MTQNPYVHFTQLTLSLLLLLIMMAGSFTSSASANTASSGNTSTKTWSVSQNGNDLQIAYGSGTTFYQYGSLDLGSSYFRLVYSSTSNWGTSLILLPAFWSQSSCPSP